MGEREFDGRLIFFSMLLLALVVGTIYTGYKLNDLGIERKGRVSKGQTWVREDSRNPFREPIRDTLEVLDVVSGYALVVWNGDTIALETELVSCCGKRLIKNSEKRGE